MWANSRPSTSGGCGSPARAWPTEPAVSWRSHEDDPAPPRACSCSARSPPCAGDLDHHRRPPRGGVLGRRRDECTTCASRQAGDGGRTGAAGHRPGGRGHRRDGVRSSPGSTNADEFWTTSVAGRERDHRGPPRPLGRRRGTSTPRPPPTGAGRKTPSKWGGFLPDVAVRRRWPTASRPPPLAAIEPVQLLASRWRPGPWRDAGYGPSRPGVRSRPGLGGLRRRARHRPGRRLRLPGPGPQYLGDLPQALDHSLPALTEDSFPGVLTNVIAGRIANRLDLGGVNYTVDAACASSLAAVDVACQGADRRRRATWCCAVGPTSTTGSTTTCCSPRCTPSRPPGVRQLRRRGRRDRARRGRRLRRPQAAGRRQRDGDRIYAVIEAVAGSSDGRSLGLTAPARGPAHAPSSGPTSRPRRSPAEVGLVEAHGTGTVVGDRTELAVLTEVFAEPAADRRLGAPSAR